MLETGHVGDCEARNESVVTTIRHAWALDLSAAYRGWQCASGLFDISE